MHFFLYALLILLAMGAGFWIASWQMRRYLRTINSSLASLAEGDFQKHTAVSGPEEVKQLMQHLNQLQVQIGNAAEFADAIGKGNFNAPFVPANSRDVLGNILLGMRDQLRQSFEDSDRQQWVSQGLAKFSEVLGLYNQHTAKLSKALIYQLVPYLGAQQGALYLLDNQQEKEKLMLAAVYAGGDLAEGTSLIPGEGLVGHVFVEKKVVCKSFEECSLVRSGLGQSAPNHAVWIPVVLQGEAYGVLTLASFTAIEPYQISLLEKICEQLAATLQAAFIHQQTKKMLQASQAAAKELIEKEQQVYEFQEQVASYEEQAFRQKKRLDGLARAMQEKEQWIASLVSGFTEPVALVNQTYTVIEANEAFWNLATGGNKERRHAPVTHLFDSAGTDALQEVLQKAFAGKTASQLQKVGKGRQEVIIRLLAYPLRVQQASYEVVCLHLRNETDFLQLKTQHRELLVLTAQVSRQVDELMTALDATGVAVLEFDMQGTITCLNTPLLKVIGHAQPDDLLHKPLALLLTDPVQNDSAFVQLMWQLQQTRELRQEITFWGPTGQPIRLYCHFHANTNKEGKTDKVLMLAFTSELERKG
jgi:methyl-accepting chemotaxis protein